MVVLRCIDEFDSFTWYVFLLQEVLQGCMKKRERERENQIFVGMVWYSHQRARLIDSPLIPLMHFCFVSYYCGIRLTHLINWKPRGSWVDILYREKRVKEAFGKASLLALFFGGWVLVGRMNGCMLGMGWSGTECCMYGWMVWMKDEMNE